MARVTFSGIGMTEMRGKIGADTISRNASGNYSKAGGYGVPFMNNTWSDYFSELLVNSKENWQDLDHDIQLEWNRAAKSFPHSVGITNPGKLSGYQLFLKCTVGIYSAAAVPSFLPVFDPPPPALNNLVIAPLFAAQIVVHVSYIDGFALVPPDSVLYICASPCVSPGRTVLYSNIGILDMIPAGTPVTPIDVTAAFLTYRGTLNPGQKVFAKAFTVSSVTGLRSVPVVTSRVVF